MLTRAVQVSCLAAMLVQAGNTAGPGGRSWYVDCKSGNDAADGHSPATAWRTTAAVSARTFQPGDAIYFRRGTVCSGMLAPHGSGSAAAPILLDAWDTGPLPHIAARAGEEAALRLDGQQYWEIGHLELSGGNPHGLFVTGTAGVLRGIHIRDLVVHDVTGEPKDKEGGLVVISPRNPRLRFEDVIVDGVTACRSSQWAGILVGAVAHGFVKESDRSTNVVVRNSIVHDVAGDGIVLFQVNRGTIENSITWHTGMQETQTIGTPNAIWTWMCRDCNVRRNEAFLSDSPGVDGGAFDIDYGNENNVVEENYGHDTQGYCIAVFGSGWATSNSTVRGNICAGNGRSPRLASRQGAVFLYTWNNGKLRGVRFTGNQIFWNPPIAAPAVVSAAEFDGTGEFENQTIESTSPFLVQANSSLLFDHNSYTYAGPGPTKWAFAGIEYDSFEAYQRGSGQDAHSRMIRAGATAHHLTKVSLTASIAARQQVAQVISLHRQFPELPIAIVTSVPAGAKANVRFDWNTGDIPITFSPEAIGASVSLTDSSGTIVWRRDGVPTPGDVGLAVRSFLGDPDYAKLGSE